MHAIRLREGVHAGYIPANLAAVLTYRVQLDRIVQFVREARENRSVFE